MLKNFLNKNQDNFFFVFRIIIGLLFLLHGWMKVPGIMNGSIGMGSLFFYAGIIEVIGGIMIIIGLFTQEVAFIGAIEMLVAFFTVHAKSGLNPLVNQGELAVLFFAAFLILLTYGAQKWCLEQKLLNKELF